MDTLTLQTITSDGLPLIAIFLPEKGMNLISLKKGDLEIIDQKTTPLFEERFSGLGPLIGPHFHQRQASVIPKISDEALFSHIQTIRSQGRVDPFSHGIARYAPWTQIKSTPDSFDATLTGKDLWNGIPLAQLEGQNFTMRFLAKLQADGLHLSLSVVSETDSIVGFHYFFRLPNQQGKVIARVLKAPEEWHRSDSGNIQLAITRELNLDHTLHHYPDPLQGLITLETEDYTLRIQTRCQCADNSWQLYHPVNASFVCIEPLSASDPHHPNLTVSAIQMHINF